MKRILRKAIFIMIILILLFSIDTEVFALGQVIQDGDSFIGAADGSGTAGRINQTSLQNLSGYLYNILLSGGVIIAVIVATVLGIQFMLGGAEGQAKVKEMLIPFIIGCIVVFGGFGIWKLAINIGTRLEHSGGVTTNAGVTGDEGSKCYRCGAGITDEERRKGKCDQCGYTF